MWIIEGVCNQGEYNWALVKNHPNRNLNGRVLEHRVIMENHLGRLLTEDEVVHHINGNKKDNKIKNLQLMTNEEHSRFHNLKKGLHMLKIKCPICSQIFIKEKWKVKKRNNSTCCSRSCAAKMSNIKKPFSNKLIKSIRENIIEEFIIFG